MLCSKTKIETSNESRLPFTTMPALSLRHAASWNATEISHMHVGIFMAFPPPRTYCTQTPWLGRSQMVLSLLPPQLSQRCCDPHFGWKYEFLLTHYAVISCTFWTPGTSFIIKWNNHSFMHSLMTIFKSILFYKSYKAVEFSHMKCNQNHMYINLPICRHMLAVCLNADISAPVSIKLTQVVS